MNINLQSKGLEITPTIRDYVVKRVTNLEKLLLKMEQGGGEAMVSFDISRNTGHNKGKSIFHADCRIQIKGQEFYGSADEEDLYASIDAIKENLFREISKNKDRKQTLFKRGAASVKKMLKGLSKRNPFTSKY
jgi:ribosomal subunit interface protein